MTLLVVAGCSGDDIINNYGSLGSIYGQVEPVESGTVVSAWQGTMVAKTGIEPEGSYWIDNLRAGIYTVKMEAPSGRRRELHGIRVNSGERSELGVIRMSGLPWPLLQIEPDTSGPSGSTIPSSLRIYSGVELDEESMINAISFAPSLTGTWLGYQENRFSYLYYFHTGPLTPGTTYEILIGPGFKTADGVAWGRSYTHRFTTAKFTMVNVTFNGPREAVRLGYRPLLATIRFNAEIDSKSIDGSIRLEPGGIVTGALLPYDERYGLRIWALNNLRPLTDYEIILLPTLSPLGGGASTTPDTVRFRTEPLMMTNFSLGSGNAEAANEILGLTIYPFGMLYCNIGFNAAISPEAFAEAVTITPPLSGIWYSKEQTEWESRTFVTMGFLGTDDHELLPGQTYVLRVPRGIPLMDGIGLKTDFAVTFYTRPTECLILYPVKGARDVSPNEKILAMFNTWMDHAATEAAFTLLDGSDTPVSGSFVWSVSASRLGEQLTFQPALPLTRGSLYSARLSTAALSRWGQNIKVEQTTFFSIAR
jgi:hypothetical protein